VKLVYAQYLAIEIAAAELVIIEGGSPFVFLEKPEELNRAIGGFLCGL
jgi:pimeloyl-ACP methyl ester carboxylesterase